MMKNVAKKAVAGMAAVMLSLSLMAGPAQAGSGDKDLSVTWAFLFPFPIPLPVWTVDHPATTITYGFLFPIWLPLPFYEYDDHGPVQPRFSELPADAELYVDGEGLGPLSGFDDEGPLAGLPDGEHTLEVTHEGRTIYEARVVLADGEAVGLDARPGPR